VLFSGGFHLPSFDEQDQFSLPVFLVTPDPNAATVFARFRHFEIPQPDEEKTTANIGLKWLFAAGRGGAQQQSCSHPRRIAANIAKLPELLRK